MLRKISAALTVSVTALSFLAAAPVVANDFPLSVNESAPTNVDHGLSPTQKPPAAPVGRMGQRSGGGEVSARVYGSPTYEVQTPSSVSESAPWRTGGQRTPTSP